MNSPLLFLNSLKLEQINGCSKFTKLATEGAKDLFIVSKMDVGWNKYYNPMYMFMCSNQPSLLENS